MWVIYIIWQDANTFMSIVSEIKVTANVYFFSNKIADVAVQYPLGGDHIIIKLKTWNENMLRHSQQLFPDPAAAESEKPAEGKEEERGRRKSTNYRREKKQS